MASAMETERTGRAAAAIAGARASPRKTAAVSLTKQATAMAPTSASATAAKATKWVATAASLPSVRNKPLYKSHSLAKPLKGGSPAIATAPTMKRAMTKGRRLPKPPSWSVSRVPVDRSTAPAAKNSKDLNRPWFQVWKSAADSPISVKSGRPSARPSVARPSAMAMIPRFSTLL